jgi:hypothetical protein
LARTLMVLDEVLAMLRTVGASSALIEKFRAQAEMVLQHKARSQAPDGTDAVTVSSGFGQATQRGFVELTLNDQLSQMPPEKAREVGLMLLQGAEAAVSDQLTVMLLKDVGLENPETHGQILMRLRELRQGTRGVSWPS